MTSQDECIARRALKEVEDTLISSIRAVCSSDHIQRLVAIQAVYRAHGAPFGNELHAAVIWHRHEQCTTVN